jgi:hypothetical protein
MPDTLTPTFGWMTDVEERTAMAAVAEVESKLGRLRARVRELTEWRPMDTAPRASVRRATPFGPVEEPVRFLGIRRGQVIVCWWNPDWGNVPRRPFWDGTDGVHNVQFCRRTPPDGWLPLPEIPRKETTA